MLVDPVTVDLLFTAFACALLLVGGALALKLLPWSEEELASVDALARDGVRRAAEEVQLTPVVIPPGRLTRGR